MITYPQARWDRRWMNGAFAWNGSANARYFTLGPGPGGALLREVFVEWVTASTSWIWFYHGWVLNKSPANTAENYAVGQPLIQRANSAVAFPRGEWRTRVGQGSFSRARFGVDLQAPEGAWYVIYGGFRALGTQTSVLMSIGYDVWSPGPAVVVAGGPREGSSAVT